jgi:hypothetical protein
LSTAGPAVAVGIVDRRVRFEVRTRTLTLETTMTDGRMALVELIEKGADADLVREMLSLAIMHLTNTP